MAMTKYLLKSTITGALGGLLFGFDTAVIAGATSGAAPPAELNRVFFLQLSVVGSTMGSRGQLARLATFLEQTGIRPRIDRTLPLTEAKAGFAAMISGNIFGKVVFTARG